MSEMILVINPGSTSTKIAVYEGEKETWVQSIRHETDEIEQFDAIFDQLQMRKDLIMQELERRGNDVQQMVAVVARGGLLPPVQSGAYYVNQAMIDQLRYRPRNEHASNLGAALAYDIASNAGVPSFVYDPVTVDEMIPITRVTGLKEVRRVGMGHNLNMRAMAIRWCEDANKKYAESNIIVAHLGGGITLSLHSMGRIIDMISDDEGPFSPERAGGLPYFQLIDLIMNGKHDKKSIMKKVKRAGGFMSHFGTTDMNDIEDRVISGDERAKLVYEALALNVGKNIAKLAVTVNGKVEGIVLTGGIAHSKMLTDWIAGRVGFIAPVVVYPGENEIKSLALGALRVMRGQETAREFVAEEVEV